ncbi:MAG: multiprotein-bridging factor 1 family protein [Bacteroidia bacterium]
MNTPTTYPTAEELGMKLRLLRDSKKWSQSALAAKLGIQDSAYGKIERGETTPNLTQMNILAKEFGMSLSELVGEEKNHYEISNATGNGSIIGNVITNSNNTQHTQTEAFLETFQELVSVIKKIADIVEKMHPKN